MVVTGLGVLSALGNDVDAFWGSLQEGRCGIRPLDEPDWPLRFSCGARLQDYQPEPEGRQALDPFAQYLAEAGRQAVADAGLEFDDELGARSAIIAGSGGGGQVTLDQQYHRLYGEGKTRVHPATIPRFMVNAGVSELAREHGITGPVVAVSTACSSANHALGQAFDLVRHGRVEVALAGGSEAPFCLGFLKAWEAMRAVDPNPCRPFSKDRKGLSLGEGAAVLVLECEERARRRGARIWGELLGFGMTSDAHDLTRPHPDGPVRAMQNALEDARVDPSQVGYINAHGTGTPTNDSLETGAIRTVFGQHANSLLVSSTKSAHGHALGAAGALEAVASLLALRHGVIPPTVNYTEPDPECDLDVVPNEARACQVDRVLSNSFAFGGLNAAVLFGRYT